MIGATAAYILPRLIRPMLLALLLASAIAVPTWWVKRKLAEHDRAVAATAVARIEADVATERAEARARELAAVQAKAAAYVDEHDRLARELERIREKEAVKPAARATAARAKRVSKKANDAKLPPDVRDALDRRMRP